TPAALGSRTVRVEVFVDDPDGFIEGAVAAGADGSIDKIRDHEAPWGVHRQGGFIDPFGHLWLVGDRSPLPKPDVQYRRSASPDPQREAGGASDGRQRPQSAVAVAASREGTTVAALRRSPGYSRCGLL